MWGKTMHSVFWNSEGISSVGFLERGATISSAERYVQTLKKLKNEFEGFGQTIWIKSSCTTPVRTPVWTQGSQLQQWCGLLSLILPTVPFSTLLLPPDRIPEGCTLTTAFCRRHCAWRAPPLQQFYANVTHTHAKVENKCADDGHVVKSNLNFVKDVSMVYVNFIIIVIWAVRKGGIRRHYFHTARLS
jgi:hypothetical protein